MGVADPSYRGEAGSPKQRAVALGEFDGVHAGHAALLKRTAEKAAELSLEPSVLLFDRPLPTKEKNGLLCMSERRDRLIADCGIVSELFLDFDEVREMSAERFVREILIGRFRCAAAFCGENFRFGKGAEAGAGELVSLMEREGKSAFVLPAVRLDGEEISSTRIRRLIGDGNCREAAKMLGRPFEIGGRILHGKRLGRVLGSPTINIEIPEGLILPRFGVYFTRCEIDGREYKGVTNIGVRPTVDGAEPNCETFLLDFDGREIYGMKATVSLAEFSRPEMKFSGIDELKNAIGRDIDTAKKYFAEEDAFDN